MEIFYIILVVLFVSRAFGEVAYRMGQPPLVGELIAGVAIGAVASTYSSYFPVINGLTNNEVFIAITNLGIFFLMLQGGVELRASDLAEASLKSLVVGACGLVVPVVVGYSLSWFFLPESDYKFAQCLLVGTALAITAVPVTISILIQLNKLDTPAGKMIISAAIIDDILSLILLAFLTGLITKGAIPSVAEFGYLILQIIEFFAIVVTVAWVVVPWIGKLVSSLKTAEFEFTSLLLGGMAFSVLAEYLHLHFILGAFVAGLLFERRIAGKEIYEKVKRRISAISTGFLAPIFFVSIGLHIDLHAVTEIPVFLILLIITAFLTKLVGTGVPAYYLGLSKRDALAVGIGMSARGAVELVIANIALRAGVFSQPTPVPPIVDNLFSAIVLVAIVTTLVTPFALKRVFAKST
jgi:Na+:H+ antiporter